MATTFKFKADGSGYARGLEQMRGQTKKFASGVAGMLGGAFAIGGIIAATRNVIAFGSAMSDLADRTNTTVKEFMTLRDVSRDAGVNQSILERALRNVANRAQAAADGNKSYAEALERLGLRVDDFVKLSTAQKFETIAKAAQNATDKSESFKDVATILGERAGPMLVEVLRRVATDGMDKLSESAAIMSDETADALDNAEDSIQKFGDSVKIRIANILIMFANFRKEMKENQAIKNENFRAVGMLMAESGVRFTGKEFKKLIDAQTDSIEKQKILNKYNLELVDLYRAQRDVSGGSRSKEELRAAQEAQKLEVEKIKNEKIAADNIGKINKLKEKAAQLTKAAAYESLSLDEKRRAKVEEIAEHEFNIFMAQKESEKARGPGSHYMMAAAESSVAIIAAEKELKLINENIEKRQEAWRAQKKIINDLEKQANDTYSLEDELQNLTKKRISLEGEFLKLKKDGDDLSADKKRHEWAKARTEELKKQAEIQAKAKEDIESVAAIAVNAAEIINKADKDASKESEVIQQQIKEEIRGREEIGMTDEQILGRRKQQLKSAQDAQDKLSGRAVTGQEEKDIAEGQLAIENLKTEIAGIQRGIDSAAPETPGGRGPSIISSSLASIGGGGGTAMFTADPLLSENQKQTRVLEEIRTALQPSDGLETGTLQIPEL